jgi:hypothetical protein
MLAFCSILFNIPCAAPAASGSNHLPGLSLWFANIVVVHRHFPTVQLGLWHKNLRLPPLDAVFGRCESHKSLTFHMLLCLCMQPMVLHGQAPA